MANVNFFSPDGGTTRYPIEDTEARSRIAGQQSLLKDTVGWTGKNRAIFNPYTQINGNITPTIDTANQKVIYNSSGETTSNRWFGISIPSTDMANTNSNILLKAGTYKLLSPQSANMTPAKYLAVLNAGTILASVGGDYSATFTLTADTYVHTAVRFAAGQTITNFEVQAMIMDASISDPTYEPYHESVEVMYEEEIHGVNLLNIPDQTLTTDGVTVSINNGVASFSGTNALSSVIWIAGAGINIPKGTYIFNGLDTTQNVVTNLQLLRSDNTEIVNTNVSDPSETVTIPNDLSNCKVHFRIVANGNTDGIKVYPMLRKADIEDSTYRPYNPQAIQNQLNAQGVLGAKNLLNIISNTQTRNGVTFTINRDSNGNVLNVTVNGTASDGTECNLCSTTDYTSQLIPEGDYIISDGGAGASNSARLNVARRKGASGTTNNIAVYGDTPIKVNYSEYDYYKIIIWVPSGATANNLTFKPMIRLASDPDDTYVPHAMTNRELTDAVTAKELKSTDDLNNLINEGAYKWGSSYPVNAPENTTFANMEVKSLTGIIVIQKIYRNGVIYTRTYNSSWGSWTKFTGTVVS